MQILVDLLHLCDVVKVNNGFSKINIMLSHIQDAIFFGGKLSDDILDVGAVAGSFDNGDIICEIEGCLDGL